MTKKAEVWQDADEFRASVQAWAQKIGVQPKVIVLREMKRKWASCSTAGRVTFNLALLGEPRAFGERVIVHELLHLKVPNHGKLFKALERAFVGQEAGQVDVSND